MSKFLRRLSTSRILYEESAMTQRMKQILEEKIHNASTTTFTDKSVHNHFNQASSYIKSEPLLSQNNHAKDIYNSKPWTGEESLEDANLRMIIDSKPKKVIEPFKPKRKISNTEKLSTAKDITLDYKINKDDGFREMYKERLLGPTVFDSNSPANDIVNSLASAKINSYINRKTGQFDDPEMSSVRGKRLSEEHLKNCTDTNYFMNQIMKKQEVIPPWIESQQSIIKSVDAFRRDLDQLWFNWIINHSFFKVYLNLDIETILYKFEENIWQFTTQDYQLPENEYLIAKVDLINREIRSYNLQCPVSTGHKLKLQLEKELKNSYLRVLENFSTKIESWYNINKKKSALVDKSGKGSGFLNLLDGGQSHLKSENTKLNFWQAVKDIFK